MSKDEKHFRAWMLKEFGRQELNNYGGTQTEEIAIRYADQQSLEFAKWAERAGYYFQDEMYGNKWQHMDDPTIELTDSELLTRFKERL